MILLLDELAQALRPHARATVFIDNLAKSDSPAGVSSMLADRVCWLWSKQMATRVIDALAGRPESRYRRLNSGSSDAAGRQQ